MKAITASQERGNPSKAPKGTTGKGEDALWSDPVLSSFRHDFRSTLAGRNTDAHGHISTLTANAVDCDWNDPVIEPEIDIVLLARPNSNQFYFRFDRWGANVDKAIESLRQQAQTPVVEIVFTTPHSHSQLTSGTDVWRVAAVGPLEDLWQQKSKDQSLEDTSAADALDIARQLEDMKYLEDGWADGMQSATEWGEQYGVAPSHKGLDWLAVQFHAHYARSLPRPYLYPTPEGGVQAEWSLGANEVSLEVDLTSHIAEWHCVNLQTNFSSEQALGLDDEAAWGWIYREIRELGSTAE